MIDIFDNKKLDLSNIVCHSGGAVGSDTEWENIGKEFGVKTMAYSYKTPKTNQYDHIHIYIYLDHNKISNQ